MGVEDIATQHTFCTTIVVLKKLDCFRWFDRVGKGGGGQVMERDEYVGGGGGGMVDWG